MNRGFHIFMISSVLILGILGGVSSGYAADELSFDQDMPLFPDHGVRIIFNSTSLGETITATVVSKDGESTVDTETFTLFLEEDKFYRSNYINLIESGNPGIDEFKVSFEGTIEVTISGFPTFTGFTIVSEDNSDITTPNLKQLGYDGQYNIGSLVDCSTPVSFYGGDTDGDGICDNWEDQDSFSAGNKGLHITIEDAPSFTYDYLCDPNASVDPSSPNYDPLGTQTCPSKYKPDIYFEIDWMGGHKPNTDSLADIVQAFSKSPFLVSGGNVIDGTIGFYKFDGDLLDSSGNGNNGALNTIAGGSSADGTAIYVTGVDGQAFDFNGSTHIETADTPFDFEFDKPFSLATWLKTSTTGESDLIFGKLPAATGYQLFLKSDDQLRIRISNSASNKIMLDTSGISVMDNNWHHVAMTYDGSGTPGGVKIYVDGLEQTLTTVDAGPLTATIQNSEPLVIGNQQPTSSYFFTGQMDSTQIYDFELSSTQVKELQYGVIAHFQLSDSQMPHVEDVVSPGGRQKGTDALKVVWYGTAEERDIPTPTPTNFWDDDVRAEKAQIFHYVIFGHDRKNGGTTSGYSEAPGNDILITLGSWDYSVGTEDHQAGALMHEIGHNLNLLHGGVNDDNCKPNYISVMTYSRQTSEYIIDRPLDFSNFTLNELSENGTAQTIISYGGHDLETAHGDSAGDLGLIMTGSGETLDGDFNKINVVGCDGSGTDLSTQKDWDPNTVSLVARSNDNWVDGLDIDNFPRGKAVPFPNNPQDQECKNPPVRPEVASPRGAFERTCPEETFGFDNIQDIRIAFAVGASSDITNFGSQSF